MKWVRNVAIGLLILLALLGAKEIFDIFRPPSSRVGLWTRYLSARDVDQLFTGLAYVAFLKFYDRRGEIVDNEPKVRIVKKGEIEGYCYRLYEVGIGFDSLAAAVAEYRRLSEGAEAGGGPPELEPELLSVNAVEAVSAAGRRGQFACDSIDASAEREDLLLEQMIADEQWDWQVKNATAKIADLVDLFPEVLDAVEPVTDAEGRMAEGAAGFRQTREIVLQMPEGDAPKSLVQLARLEITFSTVGIFSSERRVFLLWKRDDFYARKDTSRVTYGSSLSSISPESNRVWWDPASWFGTETITVSLERPRRIAVDRRIDTLVQTPRFEFRPEGEYKSIDAHMREDLESTLETIEPRAIEETERLMRLFLSRVEGLSEAGIEVEFLEPK